MVIQLVKLTNDVRLDIEKRVRIVQLDECYVTKNTLSKTTWILMRTNVQLDYKQLPYEMKAIAVAVSIKYGLDHMEVISKSITKINFKLFLEGLRRNYPINDILLHKNQDTMALMD